MAYSGTLGAMLQGVSQQPTYLRGDGQVTEQINFLPDITEGQTTRPGTDFIARVTASLTDHQWHTVVIGGETFFIATRKTDLIILNTAGVEQQLDMQDDAISYMSSDMSTYVYDNEVYIVNRNRIVESDSTAAADANNVLRDVMLATQLGGQFAHTYELKIVYGDGTEITGAYTTPDGETAGDAAMTASDHIMSEIKTSIEADPQLKGTTTVELSGSVIAVTDSAGHLSGGSVTTTDGEGGDTFRTSGTITQKVEDLPEYAPHGTLTRITGENAAQDDLWLRFETTTTTTVGGGMGDQGTWTEHYNVDEDTLLKLGSLPYKITPTTGTYDFAIGHAPWQGRRVGDSDTNPMPSFVGQPIRDIGGFQSRLVFVSGDAVVMSRTNIPVDFFKESAAGDVVSDPIDIISTSETEYQLDWVMPFDRDLIVLGGNAQFLISGGQALTPSNASMVESTNFKMDSTIRPSNTGRSVLFPFKSGSFSGVKEFFSSSSVEANEAVTLTQVQDRYIRGNIKGMPVSTSFGLMLMHTDNPDTPGTVYAYQYFFDGVEKLQNAFYKLEFHLPVEHIGFENSEVYVIMRDGPDLVLSRFDLDIPEEEDLPYNVSLDEKRYVPAISYGYRTTSVVAGFGAAGADAVAVQGAGCAIPGQFAQTTALDNGDGTHTYVFDDSTVPVGAKVYLGLRINKLLKPSMPLFRDQNGAVISNAKLNITDFTIYYDNSGQMNATISSKYRASDYTYTNATFPLSGDPDDPERDGLQGGIFAIPWGERSDWSELTITSDDIRPVTITEIEWIGQILKRGKRAHG